MASSFPEIIVYAQELLPGRVGMVAGMLFGFSFGLGGLGAAVRTALSPVMARSSRAVTVKRTSVSLFGGGYKR